MKLNYECLTNIMVELESIDEVQLPTKTNYITLKKKDALSKYREKDLEYCCIQLSNLGFVSTNKDIYDVPNPYTGQRVYSILDITPLGHKFLYDYHVLQEQDSSKKKLLKFVGQFIYDVTVGVSSNAVSMALGI